MATIGAIDLTVARVLEPHLDALSILKEAHSATMADNRRHRWGVFAAEGRTRLLAREDGGEWTLSGTKTWCSLARELDRALVTAWMSEHARGLFAIDLTDARTVVGDEPWYARGLVSVDSPSIDCDAVPAIPVGGDNWYLDRPGFAAGGIRVAAVWFGGAVGLGRTVRAASGRADLDQIGHMHLGAIDAALHRARCALADAATRLAASSAEQAAVVAGHTRRIVRESAEETLERAAHALGPAPLVRDDAHAARVADLTVYLRQEHAERDAAALGRAVVVGRGLIL